MSSVKVAQTKLNGEINIPPSKSDAQRAIICAALCSGISVIHNVGESNDVKSMLLNVQLMGATVDVLHDKIQIKGVNILNEKLTLNVGESGLGLRLLASVLSVFEGEQIIQGEGSILNRDQSFFKEYFSQNGVVVDSENDKLPITFSGKLKGGELRVDGSQSSQYISGLLMALPLLENDTILTVENSTSTPYIDMTIDTLASFGIEISNENYSKYVIKGNQSYSAATYFVESDWSSSSYWLVAAAISHKVKIRGLNSLNKQADRAMIEVLSLANCEVEWENDALTVNGDLRTAFEFDATNCPDLFPALVTLATFCNGTSVIKGVARLANKESNRALVLQEEFGKIGIHVELLADEMFIHGGVELHAAEVDAHNDHRIAMCLAIAATKIPGGLTINGKDTVNKSYPEFWEDLSELSD
ncbi:MAG TPA: 3-phosphoshikimate 1-carboxyvinyltransferase [Crocinitomicaceae bacterium]|nr:3-phosphoshikimate 1-carboxyvinyltransferase [Crocinitomicaceae bacterium]